MPRVQIAGSPLAFAGAGLVVAVGFALAVAGATEAPLSRDASARRAYAECLVERRPREACAARRLAAETLCAAGRPQAECAAELDAVDRDAAGALEGLRADPPRLLGPLHADARRARWGVVATVFLLAAVLAARRHDPGRVARVAAGAALGLGIAAVPAVVGVAAGALVESSRGDVALVLAGAGAFAGAFAAVSTVPALAGVVDGIGARARRRVHHSLAAVALGMATWSLVVGPIPGLATVSLQIAAAVLLAVAGYLLLPAAYDAPPC